MHALGLTVKLKQTCSKGCLSFTCMTTSTATGCNMFDTKRTAFQHLKQYVKRTLKKVTGDLFCFKTFKKALT